MDISVAIHNIDLKLSSLQVDVICKITKLESWPYDSKLEIWIRKIKVEI